METGKQCRLINSVDDEMGFNSVPKSHQGEGKKITDDSGNVPIGDPLPAPGSEEKPHINVIAKPK